MSLLRSALNATKLVAGNLVILGMLASLAFAATEAYLRYRYPRGSAPTLSPDPRLGWDAIPSVEAIGSPNARLSIAFIGDSFTDSKLWPELTIRRLATGGIEARGSSMGASGHGTIQTLVKLEDRIEGLQPDFVVFLIFAWNDIRDNFQFPRTVYNTSTRHRPYFDMSVSPPSLRPLEPQGPVDRALSRTEVFDKLVLPALLVRSGRTMSRDVDAFYETSREAMIHYADPSSWLPYYRPSMQDTEYVNRSYEATETALGLVSSLLREREIPLLCIGIDNAFTVDADVRDEWIPRDEDVDLALPLRRLTSVSKRLGIEFVDASVHLRELSHELGGNKLYLGPEGNLSAHLQPQAEELIAAIASDWIAHESSTKAATGEPVGSDW